MGWFYNFNIKTKLLIGFAILALITGVTGFVGYTNVHKVNDSAVKMYDETLVPLWQLQRVTASFGVIRIRNS